MKKFLDNIFGEEKTSGQSGKTSARDLQVAMAAMLLEIARVDDEFTDEEQAVIVEVLKKHFGITSDEVIEIIEATNRELDKRIDLYYFTNKINEHFELRQKIEIIELVWRVVYTDKHLDGHEDYLVHRFAKLLRLRHAQLIDAKLRVKGKE